MAGMMKMKSTVLLVSAHANGRMIIVYHLIARSHDVIRKKYS
jgi:hypothetical protein